MTGDLAGAAERPGATRPEDAGPEAEAETTSEAPSEGGDAACWAHLVCPECGAVESEGHRPGCTIGRAAPGQLGGG